MGNTASAPLPGALPLLTTAQQRTLTQRLTTVYAVDVLQTLEIVGWHLALLAKRLLEDDIIDRSIVVLAGATEQSAAGLVAARHLLNWGAWVQIVLTQPVEDHRDAPARQLTTLQAIGAPLAWAEEGWELPPADLIIDALLGGEPAPLPTGKVRELIHLANSSRAPILSLDLPSGVDPESGHLMTPHIQATATLAVALPKVGLVAAQAVCGELYLADSGVPGALYTDLGLDVPFLFSQDTIVPLMIHKESVTVAL